MAADPRAATPRWAPAPVPAESVELTGYPGWLASALVRRGVRGAAEAERFLRPSAEHLIHPAEIRGIAAAVDRLTAARGRERVAIVGDYDVDGVTATALLAAVFTACELEVEPILPRRLEEGYGFQLTHVERAATAGCGLIVTADCGSTSHEAIEAAQARGMEVIVTDHHLAANALPSGTIEVNPGRHDQAAPGGDLSGAGLAFKLALGLAERAGREVPLEALLRVACLGTICDMVPLVGENRIIASLGLDALAETRSAGLRALFETAGIRPPFNAGDVGFRIGPRINAAGRMATPDAALELLLTRDAARARQLAERLDRWNRERQETEARVVGEALAVLAERDPLPRILVAWSPDWHPGVLGIAAGRLARRFHRPAILLAVDEGRASGSGRSVPGIHLHAFLAAWSDRLERFGGHAQAIGLAADVGSLDGLRRHWEEAAEEWDEELLVPRLEWELACSAADIDPGLLAAVEQMAPFGIGNRRPLLKVGPLQPYPEPRRFGRGHLAVAAGSPEGATVDLLGWGWQERESELRGTVEILAYLERDRYRDGPVLRLVDARAAE